MPIYAISVAHCAGCSLWRARCVSEVATVVDAPCRPHWFYVFKHLAESPGIGIEFGIGMAHGISHLMTEMLHIMRVDVLTGIAKFEDEGGREIIVKLPALALFVLEPYVALCVAHI